jgi:hypothetical protein
MLFEDGKPTNVAGAAKAEISVEAMQAMMEQLGKNMADAMRAEMLKRPMGVPVEASQDDSPETLQRLAKAMSESKGVEGKNFETLGKDKKVEADKEKVASTLELLKNME